ncbi:unnamed protein product [Ilex paraguariensis]|uniref:Cytochrome P450 n=1 Tax=Ilex paraguariensis TaxID=185542 RepID=A0ABC8U354_9AQUA
MEPLIYLTSLLLILSLFLLVTKRSPKNLPPGSMGLPIIGQSLSFLQAMRANKGEQWLQERIKKYGPISKLNLFGTPTVFLHGQAANKFIYTCDDNTLVSRQPVSVRRICGDRNIFELTGNDHKCIRAAIGSFLKVEVLKKYVGKMDKEIRMHLHMHWHGKEEVKVMPKMKTLTFNIICSLILGIEQEPRRDVLAELFQEMMEGMLSVPVNFPFTRFNRSLRAAAKTRAIIMDLIAEKRMALQEKRASP